MNKTLFYVIIFVFFNCNLLSNNIYINKILITSDREYYYTGDYINFTLFVVDYETNTLDYGKQIVFVELINPEKKIIKKQNLLVNNGVCFSFFTIEDSLIYGNYQIRAFSSKNKYFASEYYSSKNIFISTSNFFVSQDFFNSYRQNKNKKVSFLTDCFNFTNRSFVFYKIDKSNLNNLKVYIEKNNKIVSNQSTKKNDILSFINSSNDKNYIVVKNKNKTSKKVAFSKKFILHDNVDFYNNTYDLVLVFNNFDNNCLVEIENNGYIYNYFFSKDSLYIPKSILKTGISKIVVSYNNKIVNKFYYQNINMSDSIIIESYSNKIILKNISKSELFFSVSISNDTIQNKFYTNSYVYNEIPYKYTEYITNNEKTDVIFLLKNAKFQEMYNSIDTFRNTSLFQRGINIKGRVSGVIENYYLKEFDLKLSILNSFNDVYYTKTNQDGIFEFNDIIYYDSIYFLIEATKETKIKFYVIDVFNYDTTEIFFNPYLNIDMSVYKLKKSQNSIDKRNYSNYGDADNTFYAKDIKNSGATNIFEFLTARVPGLTISGNKAVIRGINSFVLPNEPLYLINDIPVDKFAVEDVDINSVERIDVVKGASKTSLYGQRGANGIISLYTKQGYNIKWGYYKGMIAGISKNLTALNKKIIQKIKTFEWIPYIYLSQNDSIVIPLDISNNCLIKINGITSDGKIIEINKSFNN